jgi:hypothetical protein
MRICVSHDAEIQPAASPFRPVNNMMAAHERTARSAKTAPSGLSNQPAHKGGSPYAIADLCRSRLLV